MADVAVARPYADQVSPKCKNNVNCLNSIFNLYIACVCIASVSTENNIEYFHVYMFIRVDLLTKKQKCAIIYTTRGCEGKAE